MKRIVGLLAILVVALLGGYYATGVLTEKTLKNNLATINDPNGLAVSFSEYHRGWFKSTAVLDTKLRIPARTVKGADGQMQTVPEQNMQLPLPMTINHGPIILSKDGVHFGIGYAHSVIQIPADYQEKFDALFSSESEKPKLDVSIFVNYLNRSTVKFGVPAFKAKTKENDIQIDWKGMQSSSVLSPNMDKLAGDIEIEGFHAFKAQEIDVNMGAFNIDYDLKKIASGIFLGPSNLDLDSFTVKVKDKNIFHLADFSIESDSGIDENLFYASMKLSLEKVEAKGKIYGPGKFEISLKNLDSAALLKIHQQAIAMQQVEENQRQQQLMAMLPELPALFNQGPRLEISQFEFTMPEGQVEGYLKLEIPKEENSNPLQMLQKLQGNGRLSMPAPVLKALMIQSAKQKIASQPDTQQALMQQLQKDGTAQAAPAIEQLATTQVDSQIANLTNSGAIVLDGANYVIEFELKDGKCTINGKPFTPAMMQY